MAELVFLNFSAYLQHRIINNLKTKQVTWRTLSKDTILNLNTQYPIHNIFVTT